MKKVICLIMVVMFLTSGFLEYTVKADEKEVEIPTFKVKKINGGTGVKIIINKTKGADGYHIYLTKRENADSKYNNQNGIFEGEYDFYILQYTQDCFKIDKNGSKKRTFTIKGLPKGKYSFVVSACAMTEYGYLDEKTYSVEKSVKIKAGKKIERKEVQYDFSSVKKGDVIEFGAYEQDDDMNNGKEPIEWIVLSVEDNQMLVISKYVLDRLPYDKCTWVLEKSAYGYLVYKEDNQEWNAITEWLNNNFYKTAFSKNERKLINGTPVVEYERIYSEDDYTIVETPNNYNVSMLTEEALSNEKYGFSSDLSEEDVNRCCTATEYAIAQGVKVSGENLTLDGQMACRWWGLKSEYWEAPVVSDRGNVYEAYFCDDSGFIYNNGLGVRPAIYIRLE